MSLLICTALAAAVIATSASAEYIEWTSAAVTARPHVKAVIPLQRLSLKSWPIDSLSLNVDMAGSRSEIGLNPVLVADIIHSSWCSRVTNGSAIRYLPLNHYVPSPAATWNLNDGKTVLSTKHVTNWVKDVCVVIRPLGRDISSKVSASAWTKRMNVEMGVGLDSALKNMLVTMVCTVSALLGVVIATLFGVRKSTVAASQMRSATSTTTPPQLNDLGDDDNALFRGRALDSDGDDDDDDDDDEDDEDGDDDDDCSKLSENDADYDDGYDDARSISPESNGKLCEDGFVDVKTRPENGISKRDDRQ